MCVPEPLSVLLSLGKAWRKGRSRRKPIYGRLSQTTPPGLQNPGESKETQANETNIRGALAFKAALMLHRKKREEQQKKDEMQSSEEEEDNTCFEAFLRFTVREFGREWREIKSQCGETCKKNKVRKGIVGR